MRPLRFGLLASIVALGCNKAATVRQADLPAYDAAAIAQSALTDFDKNNDGFIDATEMRASPALLAASTDLDANRDRRLSADEIRQRVEAYAAGRTGSVPTTCIVRLDGKSLEGATVTLEPEHCMQSVLKTAVGKTDREGMCVDYTVDGKTFRGVPAGLYRIRVTKDGVAIPARFNEQSILGREVFHDTRKAEVTIELDLPSR